MRKIVYRDIKNREEYIRYYQQQSNVIDYANKDLYGANPLLTEVERRYIERAISQFKISKNLRLLDLASGAARITSRLENSNRFTVGVDSSLSMIRSARKRTKSTYFVNGDITHLPFKAGVFDLATGFKFMINLPRKTRIAILKEARRLVKKDGLIIINYHLNEFGLRGIRDILFAKRKKEKVISVFRAKSEFSEAGIKPVAVYGVNMIVLYRLFSFLANDLLVAWDTVLGNVFPVNYFSDTFIVAGKAN